MSNTSGLARVGEEALNKQGCLVKIIEYNNANDIVVEFQDKYKARVHTKYCHFLSGDIKNPYYPSVLGVGMKGCLYPTRDEYGNYIKEYTTWNNMLKRCFDKKEKEKHKTYKNVCCCDEWLVYDNFYKWATTQSNYNLWKCGGNNWHLDKDILSKDSVYSPKTCCFVPDIVNKLFNKQRLHRSSLPIGVQKNGDNFMARCRNPLNDSISEYLGTYKTPLEAFLVYKTYKEDIIKQIAQIEFDAGNITEDCYNAMMKYEVRVTD